MIFYRPTDGDVHGAALKWRPKTCFLMGAMGGTLPVDVSKARQGVTSRLKRAGFSVVDAASVTTGKDYLLKIWLLAVSCPVGIAIVHEGIRPETMANVFYELGLMHAYGRETVVIRVDDVNLPSDLVRTEYIPFDGQFAPGFRKFLESLRERSQYYLTLADQLENNPLLAIDYLRRSYLLSGDKKLKSRARQIFDTSGLTSRGPGSVERLMLKF